MKRLLLFILFTGICCFALGQQKLFQVPYHPQMHKAAIDEFLKDMKKQTGMVVEYSSESFDANIVVQLNGEEATVGEVLQKILKGLPVKVLVHNNKIIIIPSSTPFISFKGEKRTFNFYGYVKEKETGEPLICATIYEPATYNGVITNNQGYFNLKLSEGEHILKISYAGMKPVTLKLNIQNNLHKDVSLSMHQALLATVVVKSDPTIKDGAIKAFHNHSNNLMNENDPLRFLYMYPGLQNASYSFSAFQVRGGGMDENLFLLDGNRVYNPTHLLGAISIINPTVLKSMRFYKSDFPARLGGSLSSVLEVFTKQGNMKYWQGEVNAGLLAGSLTLEGPLVTNKVAVMISGRKNIPFSFYQNLRDGMQADFYDMQFRLSALLGHRSKLAVNFYKGQDEISQTGKYIYNLHKWGNTIGSVSWNYILGSRSFIKTSVNYSEYDNLGGFQYSLFEKEEDADADPNTDSEDSNENETETDLSLVTKYIGSFSSLKNYNIKSKAEIYVSENTQLNVGAKLSRVKIKPLDTKITSDLEDDEADFDSFDPLQFETLSLYGEAEIKLTRKFFIKPGLRVTGYQFEDYRTLTFQPRFYVVYHITPAHKLYASYSRMNQFLHRVTNPYAGANRDFWVPATEDLVPEASDIYDIGYTFQHWPVWKLSLEGYYKRLMNVTNYAEGKSTFINNDDWEESIELGKGRSYGAEVMIKKHGDRFFWQIGYALSWSWRQFNSINNGKEFPYKYDHRHALNVGVSFVVSPHIDISGLWSFATGNVYSIGGVVFADSIQQTPTAGEDPLKDYRFIYHYSKKDQYRAKSYQRYDLSITYHSLKKKKIYSIFKAGIYNINGASDQYSYNVRGALNTKSIRINTGTSTFNIIPYLSYTLKF